MNKRQENKLTMFVAVKNVYDKNQNIWETIPAITNTYKRFNDNLNILQETLKAQETEIQGITETKSKLSQDLVNKTLEISGVLHAYANSVGNLDLKARTSLSRSELETLRDNIATEKCRQILGDAQAVSEKLTDYGITSEILTDYSNKIDEYAKIVAAPRAAIVERKSATEIIPDLIRNVDDVLVNELDRLMERFRSTDEIFYSDYFSARQIVDAGLRKEKVLPENGGILI